MKRFFFVAAAALFAFTANAQLNYTVQTACHPDDVKHYDTERLRSSFLMEKVMAPDEINLTYTLYDRLIYGGAMPVNKTLVLETFDELKAEHFLDSCNLGTYVEVETEEIDVLALLNEFDQLVEFVIRDTEFVFV
jgi:4-deoxy-L-threo-5-hexosulose-uronate ketol-isomerase